MTDSIFPATISVRDVLAGFGVPLAALEPIRHGAVVWRGYDYFVQLETMKSEAITPYSIQTGMLVEGDERVTAHCALTADLGVLYAQYTGGLPASEEDFGHYLEHVLSAIDGVPEFITEEGEEEGDEDDDTDADTPQAFDVERLA